MNNFFIKEFKQFKKSIKNVDVVSFDIFDTLLIRPYEKPTDLFKHIEHELASYREFYKERILAEKRARKKALLQEDITYDDIYNEICEKYSELKNTELEYEKNCLEYNPAIKEFYELAVTEGKKIIAISDMYLPQEFLKNLLKANGYTQIQEIYVSSSIFKCKGSTNLYKYVLNELNISANKILHVGDNYISDYLKAKQTGLKAIYVEKYIDKFQKTTWGKRLNKIKQAKHSFEYSIVKSNIAKKIIFSKNEYWQIFSYIIGGFFALSYLQYIAERIKFHDIEQILFVSRDGYLLEKIFNKYFNNHNSYKTNYIYAPRILNLKCFYDYRNNPEYIKSIISTNENIFSLNKNISKYKISELLELHHTHKSTFEKIAQKHKQEYENYINTLNIPKKNIALVDVTTGAYSSLSFLKKFFGSSLKLGFYAICFRQSDEFIYNQYFDKIFTSKEDFIVNIIELLITAPEPPIKDLINLKPIYKPINKYDIKRIEIYNIAEKEIIELINDFQKNFKIEKTIIPPELVLNILLTFYNELSSEDKKHLKNVYHSADAKNENYKPIYIYKNPLFEQVKEIKHYYLKKIKPKLVKIKKHIFNYILTKKEM